MRGLGKTSVWALTLKDAGTAGGGRSHFLLGRLPAAGGRNGSGHPRLPGRAPDPTVAPREVAELGGTMCCAQPGRRLRGQKGKSVPRGRVSHQAGLGGGCDGQRQMPLAAVCCSCVERCHQDQEGMLPPPQCPSGTFSRQSSTARPSGKGRHLFTTSPRYHRAGDVWWIRS